MVIVVDDEDRENEGDLTIAAEKVTPEAINFMARHGRGLICLSMTPERLDELEIPLMVSQNTSRFETAFCVPIEVKGRTTTGISAADRAMTALTAIDPATKPSDLARPGHMFPLRSRTGGVMVRAGQTEAAVDLARIAGLYPAGVICEVMNEDGTMARVPQLAKFARKHGLLLITIADLIKYRIRNELCVKRVATARLPTKYGTFQIHAFENLLDKHPRAQRPRDGDRRVGGQDGAGRRPLGSIGRDGHRMGAWASKAVTAGRPFVGRAAAARGGESSKGGGAHLTAPVRRPET